MNESIYQARDAARRHSENHRGQGVRSARSDFDKDRARVLHSSALRRLGAKTQVLGPMQDDYIRTRLTHSLEVAQVGRGIAKQLGANPEIVDAACLSHDLGHPPFGHNGERALAQVAAQCGGFEGNAQTLRILTRLEPKIIAEDGQPAGLNLTRATLDACVKYPWAAGENPQGGHKFGVYPDDAEVFAWVREDSPGPVKCLEAQIMDLADDIGYSVHDVEDAIRLRAINPDPRAWSDPQRAEIFAVTRKWYGSQFSDDRLDAALNRLTTQAWWLHSFSGNYQDLAHLKDLSSQAIGRFVSATARATREAYGDGPLGRYQANVEVPREQHDEIVALKGLATYFVMVPREHQPQYLHERTLLFDLTEALLDAGAEKLEPQYAQMWHEAENDAARLRVVVDQIASLTDVSASHLHASLCGMLSTQL